METAQLESRENTNPTQGSYDIQNPNDSGEDCFKSEQSINNQKVSIHLNGKSINDKISSLAPSTKVSMRNGNQDKFVSI